MSCWNQIKIKKVKIGHVIDRAAWKVADKLEWSAIQRWVQNLASKAFGEDELKAFQEQYKDAKPWDMTKWNILTEREQESGIWQRWEKWWQYWALTAETLAAWNLAGWWAKAIWVKAWSKLLWWLAWATFWAWEWVLWAEAYARWLEDRASTKQERQIWAWVWMFLGWLWWYKATAKALNQNKQLAWLVQDTSKAWKERAIAEWRTVTKKWLLGTTQEQQLSQQEKEAIDIINKQRLWNWKNPQALYNNVKKEITNTAKEMSDDMKNIKVKEWSKQWVKDALEDLKNSPETRSSVKKTIDNLLVKLDKVDNADDLWNIRKEFDWLFTAWQKAWYGKWWTTEAMYDAWQDGRKILNNALQKAWEDAWSSTVREWMRKLSNLITAENNISNNMLKTIWKESKTWLWRNRKTIWWTAIWLWVGKKALNKVSWNNSWYTEE